MEITLQLCNILASIRACFVPRKTAVMMYAKCKMALNNDLIDKVLFVQNEQKMSEIPLTSQFDLSFSGTKNLISNVLFAR